MISRLEPGYVGSTSRLAHGSRGNRVSPKCLGGEVTGRRIGETGGPKCLGGEVTGRRIRMRGG